MVPAVGGHNAALALPTNGHPTALLVDIEIPLLDSGPGSRGGSAPYAERRRPEALLLVGVPSHIKTWRPGH